MEEQIEAVEPVKKRGRKKKEEVVVQIPDRFRSPDGLLNSVNYRVDELGFVDWKALVPLEHLALNRYSYAAEGINVDALSPEEVEKFKATDPESKKLILLSGFKYLARLRGIRSQEFKVVDADSECATVSCRIQFVPNFENPDGLEVTAVMSQWKEKTDAKFQQFLVALASNRALIRCVKEALNITVLGFDEIDNTEKVEVKQKVGDYFNVYQKKCEEFSLTFDDVRRILTEEVGVEFKESWTSHETLPVPTMLTLVGHLKKAKKNDG